MMLAGSALADECHDLWFTRNLVMDRAGYCFGSALGQAQFDNTDCLGKSVSLSPEWQRFVMRLQQEERARGCRVNTAQTVLDLPDAPLRRSLETLPIVDSTESACLGWRASPAPLYAGTNLGSRVTGYVQQGDNLYFGHLSEGTWEFVIVSGPDWAPRFVGWRNGLIPADHCSDWAG